MKRCCQLLCIVALLVWPAGLQAKLDDQGSYHIIGYGNSSCGDWTSTRKMGVTWEMGARGRWVLGYVTAVNRFGAFSSDISKGTDADGLWAWIDNYCAQHPLENLAEATDNLVLELTGNADSQ